MIWAPLSWFGCGNLRCFGFAGSGHVHLRNLRLMHAFVHLTKERSIPGIVPYARDAAASRKRHEREVPPVESRFEVMQCFVGFPKQEVCSTERIPRPCSPVKGHLFRRANSLHHSCFAVTHLSTGCFIRKGNFVRLVRNCCRSLQVGKIGCVIAIVEVEFGEIAA